MRTTLPLLTLISLALVSNAQLLSHSTGDKGFFGDEFEVPAATIDASNLNFSATLSTKTIILNWFCNDADVSRFIVQHSSDNMRYDDIGFVNKSPNNNYVFEVLVYNSGQNFYRIIQLNESKQPARSTPVSVNCGISGTHILNTTSKTENIDITVQVRNAQAVTLELLNDAGSVVQELFKGTMESNEIVVRMVNEANFSAGKYFIVFIGEDFRDSKPVALRGF